MKLLFCTLCGDILSPHRQNNVPRWCLCTAHAVWWVDGARGILRVHSKLQQHDAAYVLGINNDFLEYPWKHTAQSVKDIDEACPNTYLFKQWGTPLIRIRPGESNDTAWEATVPAATGA